MDLNRFFEDLASQKPVPGGGSASCVSAAMAVSLMEMVAQLSIGRGSDKIAEEQLKDIFHGLGKIKAHLFELAEEDAKGYQKVINAFKLPKSTEEEIKIRKKAIQKAFEDAIASPLTLMKTTVDLLDWNVYILEHGNKNAFSDAGVAFYLLEVAFEGGKMNVLINLSSIHESTVKHVYTSEISDLENSFNAKKRLVETQMKDWATPILE